jgi:hypothetical protein
MKCKICLKDFYAPMASTLPFILICHDCVKKELKKN